MVTYICMLLAGTVGATPSGDPQSLGKDLLRREKTMPENMGIVFEDPTFQESRATDERPQRSSTRGSYSLTEKQMAAAHALGKAIARQPDHEQTRMVTLLHAIVATADARQKEHEHRGNKGPVSLTEVAKQRAEVLMKLDTVPHHHQKPIRGATKESLAKESEGFPKSLVQEAAAWQHQSEQHPPNALPEYWRRQNLTQLMKYVPQRYTQKYPELPPDLSAFEKDNFEGNEKLSEYFGPFRLDYSNHILELLGWNLVVSSPYSKPGLGNLVIGHANFYSDSSNAFLVGDHNTARGDGIAVVGGADNEAEGNGDVIVGGEDNVAEGEYSENNGGYRNEAVGFYDVTSGGTQNVAGGNFAVVSGGQNNYAEGIASSITGGRGNQALGILTAVHGGAGNKALGNESTVIGGVGFDAEDNSISIWNELDEQDRETVASADFSKAKHAKAAFAQTVNMDYMS